MMNKIDKLKEIEETEHLDLLEQLMSFGRKQRRQIFGKQAKFSEQFKAKNKAKKLKEMDLNGFS